MKTSRKSGRWKRKVRAGVLFAVAALVGVRARASMAVLVEQPYGKMTKVFNPSGHSAIYFDHICAASLTKLRPCGPGELGVVVSRYDGIAKLDWLAIPLLPYLYGVENSSEIPDSVDKDQVWRIRDAYRRAHLESVAPDLPDGKMPEGNWYELVGSAYDRTSYGFSVKTTPEDDVRLIALFNDGRNKERYNGLFVNCADFARVTLNRVYPHAVRRNFVADLGLTSPKSVARGLSHYAKKHPEVDWKTFVVPQVKGSVPRSGEVVDAAEGVLKRYGVPLVLISPTTAGVALVAYLTQGRFAMPKDAPVLPVKEVDPVSTPVSAPITVPAPVVAIAAPTVPPVEPPLVTVPAVAPPVPVPTPSTSGSRMSQARAGGVS